MARSQLNRPQFAPRSPRQNKYNMNEEDCQQKHPLDVSGQKIKLDEPVGGDKLFCAEWQIVLIYEFRYSPLGRCNPSVLKTCTTARFLNAPLRPRFAPTKKGHHYGVLFVGGDKRDRTADLLNAIQALSQLSYTPIYVVATSLTLPYFAFIVNPYFIAKKYF